MKRPDPFTREDQRAISGAVRSGEPALCPVCESPLDEWPVPPRPDVSYVRDRVWLVCAPCSRSVVVDRAEPHR